MMDERILVNRFSLDDPDWDLLLCDEFEDPALSESKKELEQSSASPQEARERVSQLASALGGARDGG